MMIINRKMLLTRFFKSYFLLFTLVCITPLLTPFFSSAKESTNCDLRTPLISLEENNSSLADIFSNIAKQLDYSIKISDKTILTHKKTIFLTNHPLDLSIKRILSSFNYSVICDEAKKSLEIVMIGKSNMSSQKQLARTRDTMGGATNSQKSYLAGEMKATTSSTTNSKDKSAMAGVSRALEDYRSGNITAQTPATAANKDDYEMAGVSIAQQDYQSSNTIAKPPVIATNNNDYVMAGVSMAQQDYQNNNSVTKLPTTASNKNDYPMAGVSVSLNDYRKSGEEVTE